MSITLPRFDEMRAAMAFIEASDLLSKAYPYVCNERIMFMSSTPEEFATLIREMRGTITAPLIKSESANYREVSMMFGSYKIEINLNLAAHCDQVQVGEETVEVDEVVVPAVVEKRTVTRPILEWQCKPVLAAASETLTPEWD